MAPQGQLLQIDYHAPDLKLPDEDNGGDSVEAAPEEEKQPPDGDENGGLDNQWNKRMKERLEQMKSKRVRDMSVTVTQKSSTSTGNMWGNAAAQRKTSEDEINKGDGRVREELGQTQGTIQFQTSEEDDPNGTIEICVQSILASVKNPARFAFSVQIQDNEHTIQTSNAAAAASGDKDTLDSSQVSNKMSRLERDLQTLQNRVKACLNNADFNKEQETAFHQASVSMNRAATYWPMIQLMVLLVTGFTQANHIVHYMKQHHIGV